MEKSFEFSAIARRIMNEQVTAWCPKEGRTTDLETPRSCQLGRILAHELRSDDCTVVHQTPILPDSKPSSKQDVDIAVFCEETTSGDGQVAVLLEYKPRNNFDDFEAQSACYAFEFSAIARRIMNEQVTAWCPKEGRTTDLETPRSCQLGRILAHELRSDDCTVVHQTPILPDSKPSSKQDVDIAVFCEETTSGDGQVAVLLEYKPRNNFDDFEAQSACYGTDYMSVSQRSVLGVQVHGTDMNCLNIRAFGIVPWISEPNEPPFRKVMLMEGKNEDGLKMLISGIKGYLQNYKTEIKGTFMEYMLSNVTSLHKKSRKVVKGYDYRDRNVAEQDRRKPNIELVREFIDPNAEETEIDDDLCIVTTKFHGREDGQKWFHRVPAAMLGRLLENLQTLHGKGFVHGDIRLLNCILHTGMIVDFDFCRREGERYPSTLRLLKRDGSDGGRAQDVVQAIADSTVGSLGMEKSHDLESMLYLLQLFRPVVSGPEAGSTFSGWWDRNVKGRANFLDLFELIGPLKEFASKSDLVELSLSVDGGRAI